ncbi:hypothetical protein [Anaerosporobacter sp.]|nr:hypothetical protein [Anaerosporobacter sp.]
MNVIKAVESFEYFRKCTSKSFHYWRYWGKKMIKEWKLNPDKLKGVNQ